MTTMNNRWQDFNYIMDNHNINSQQKALLLSIFRFINSESKLAYPSIETLMRTSGIKSKSTFLKVRRELVELSLIQYNQHGNKCLYQLTLNQAGTEFNTSGTEINRTGTDIDLEKKNKRKNEPINNILTSVSGADIDLLNFIMSKENPDYDYLHNFGWMYSELSSEWIC